MLKEGSEDEWMHDAQNKQVDKLSVCVYTAYEGRKRGMDK